MIDWKNHPIASMFDVAGWFALGHLFARHVLLPLIGW